MLKLAGAILVIFSTSFYGLSYSSNIQKRIDELKTLKRIFTELYGDVEYGACSLQESFFRIGNSQDTFYKKFLHRICQNMKNGPLHSFSEIFEKVAEEELKISALKKEDLESLMSFAAQLGNHQRESQLRVIKIFLHDLEQKISQLEKDRISKQKLSRVLGVSSGILIVILLL